MLVSFLYPCVRKTVLMVITRPKEGRLAGAKRYLSACA